jgi:hypothetical protein
MAFQADDRRVLVRSPTAGSRWRARGTNEFMREWQRSSRAERVAAIALAVVSVLSLPITMAIH